MTDAFASVNGHRARGVRLYVANVGPWFADCELDEQTTLAGAVTLKLGSSQLSGTVAPGSSGDYGLATKVRVVAGGGGWGKQLGPKHYHNDVGVRALNVATDAAREAGEKLGTFSPGAERVGNDFVRRSGPAAVALELAAGGVPWWVDFSGATNVAARPTTSIDAKDYDLVSFDHTSKVATLGVDDPAKLVIGGILTNERLAAPVTIRELDFVIDEGGAIRVFAWCGGDDSTSGRLERLFSSLVDRILARKLFGRYRYRVVTMAPDGRANLQAVSKAPGLPDVLPVRECTGGPGMWADLVLGSQVFVEFIAGDPGDPIVSGFPGRGEPGFVPTKTTIGADTPGAAAAAARQGDAVKVLLPPAVFTGTIGGAPASGVLTFPTGYTLGTIQTGSGRVGIGT